MATRFCAFCGKPLPGTGTFCPSCGAAISGGVAAPAAPTAGYPSGFPPVVGYGPMGGAPGAGVPSPATRPTDLRALKWIEWAMILSLVSSAVGVAVDLSAGLTRLVRTTTTPTGTTISLPSPWVFVLLLGVAGVFAVAEIFLFRVAFRDQSEVDRRFSSPSTLAFLALIGVIGVVVGAGLVVGGLYQAVSCAGTGVPITRACLPFGLFFGGIALLLIGAIVALVGFIGILIGIWRLGTRYNETLFKVGAILLIIPFVNLVGAILILIGARSARRNIEGSTAVPVPQGAG